MRVSGVQYVQGRNSYSDADGTKYGIAIHNTSNTASADNEAAYATRRTDGVSSHFYADATKVIQSLDTSARAGHAGSSQGNQNAVAVEIRGVNEWSRQTWLDSVCWDQLGRVLADVCRTYGIQVRRASVAEMRSNPKVKAFYSHDDMRQAWGGTDHTDPGPGFPWDRLFSAVTAALTGEDDDMASAAGINASRNSFATTQLQDNYLVIAGDVDGGKQVEVSNPLAAAVKQLLAAATADQVRDDALAAAVKALAVGSGIDADGLMERVEAAVADAVKPLQDQLAAVEARNVKLAQALAAAGGALDSADD